MRDIDAAADSGHERAIIARDAYPWHPHRYIGNYAAVMNSVDVIVSRPASAKQCGAAQKGHGGLRVHEQSQSPSRTSRATAKESVISAGDSKVKICVIPRTREIVIARDTLCIVTGSRFE